MPNFSNGKVTSSVIFYDRGVSNNLKIFGKLTTLNYEMLKQIAKNNIKNKRPLYSFM